MDVITLVNGKKISRNESETIPANGGTPHIYLACDTNYPLDWEQVRSLISRKLKEIQGNNEDNPMGETVCDPVVDSIISELYEEEKNAWVELGLMIVMIIIGTFIFGWLWIAAGVTGINVFRKDEYKSSHRYIALVLGILCIVGYAVFKVIQNQNKY